MRSSCDSLCATTKPAPSHRPAMIPLPPDREYVEAFEKIRSRGFMIDATFPDADDRVYFSEIGYYNPHCAAAVSTSGGRLSVVYSDSRDKSLGRDELCRRAYEALQKLRVKGGYG